MQSATGAHWVSLTAEQRTCLIEAFEQYAVSLCAAFFDGYSGQRFEIVGEAKTSTGDPSILVKIFARQVSSRDFGALRGVDASHSEKRWRDINMTGKRGSPVDPLHRDRLLEGQMNAFLVRKRPLAAQPMGRWRVDWTHQFYSTFQPRQSTFRPFP